MAYLIYFATISLNTIIIIFLMASFINAQPDSLMSMFDATWDALKCAMKIGLMQLSKYHNNQMSCCGLWIVKWFIKTSAQEYCDHPAGSIAIFDKYINGDLIYSPMVRTILGDETLSCDKYPENSSACTRLWILLIILMLIIFFIIFITIIWCLCATTFWYRTRKENHQLKNKMISLNGTTDINKNGLTGVQKDLNLNSISQTNSVKPFYINGFTRQSQVHDSSLSDKIPIPIEDINNGGNGIDANYGPIPEKFNPYPDETINDPV